MTTISATVIKDSISEFGKRITTLQLRYPRFIHAELMTHRVFSRNASSSRAIPVAKLIQDVLDNPAVPMFWGKNQKGMQAGEEHNATVIIGFGSDDYVHGSREEGWIVARDSAVLMAREFDRAGYHKQIVNRLLEPFSHINVVVTATEWTNFFALRRHEAAEPHIHLLADRIFEAMEASTPELLKPGQWHLPYVTEEDWKAADSRAEALRPPRHHFPTKGGGAPFHDAGVPFFKEARENLLKLSVARCASVSYKTVDGLDMTLERAIDLYDKLVGAHPMHASPAEHQATPDQLIHFQGGDPHWSRPEWHGNFVGWKQYRKTLPGESQ